MPDIRHSPASTALFTRHRGPVTSVAAIPGTDLAVTGAYDGAVGLFDLATGAVSLLGYHRHLVNHVTVDADGRRAASSSSDYDIQLWDLDDRRPGLLLRGHADDVECFAFVDAVTGVSASRDRRIIVWNLETGAIRRVIEGHDKDVLSVTVRDGLIYSAGDDMTLRQWDLATGEARHCWGPFETETDTCAVDTAHHRAILGCDDGVIRVFDSRNGASLAEIPAHSSGIKKVAVSPVTGDILSCAYDQKIRIWDSSDFSLKVELAPQAAKWERSFCWTPDGARLLAGTFDGTLLSWDAATGALLGEVGGGSGERGNACFNEASGAPDGMTALVADDGLVRLVHLRDGLAELTALTEPAAGRVLMNAVTRDPAAGRVATGAHDHRLHLFDALGDSLAPTVSVALGQGPINCLRFAHHAGHEGAIFAACYSGAIVRYLPRTGEQQTYPLHDGAVKALRLHPTLPLGVSCSADGGLLTWTLTGERVRDFPGHTAIVDDVDFSPSGTLIASASRDFTLHVYSVADGRLIQAVDMGRRSPKSLCFWDEQTVLVGDYWGAVLKIDVATGRVERRTVAANGLSSITRCADGVAVSSYDGAVHLLSVPDLAILSTYRVMTQRLDKLPGWSDQAA